MHTILNFSGVYDEESWLPEGVRLIDLSPLEGTNCYCDSAAAEAVRKAIEGFPAGGIHWIDTGDYHYVSLFWMEKIAVPFCLALFDNHPDDQAGAFGEQILSCGSWVKAARGSLPLMEADYLNPVDIPGSLPAYLSIDLDVLSPEYSRTDWSQGDMTPDELLRRVEAIASGHRILGVDICGGITTAKGARPEDLAANARLRTRLYDYFSNHPPLSG